MPLMAGFELFGHELSRPGPTLVVAEVANTHEGNRATAIEMVQRLSGTGVTSIKFQLHLPEAEMIRSHPKFHTQTARSLSLADLKELKLLVEELGMNFLCTPFSREASDELERLRVSAMKIGSGEVTDPDFVRHVARKGIPTILSTGMTSPLELDRATSIFLEHATPFMLLHCISVYPTPNELLRLDTIQRLKERYGIPIGFSCHTPNVRAPLMAAALGARVLECHYTLDRATAGTSDHRVSLQPLEFAELVDSLRELEAARGVREGILPEEQPTISWARHAVVTVRPVAKGQTIRREDISTKRPLFDGVPADQIDQVIGAVAANDLGADELVRRGDLATTSSTH